MKSRVGAAATVALAFLIAGCASSQPRTEPGSAANAGKYGLPSDIHALTVGTTVGSPPYEYFDSDSSTEIKGYEPDLLMEAAKRLGIKIEMQPTDQTAIFSGLDAGRYDLLATGLIDRKSRQERYDLVDYIRDDSRFLGKKGSTTQLKTLDDVCGKTLAIVAGNTHEAFFEGQSKTCVTAGREPIKQLSFRDGTGTTLAVQTGRADYVAAQSAELKFAAQQSPDLEAGGPLYLEGLVAMIFPKNSNLIPPFQKVLDEMMSDGTYQTILKKWNMDDQALPKTEINAGTAE